MILSITAPGEINLSDATDTQLFTLVAGFWVYKSYTSSLAAGQNQNVM